MTANIWDFAYRRSTAWAWQTMIGVALLSSFNACNGQDASLNYQWINVRNTGATGDGTTDDSRAIQAAIYQAQSISQAAVYIPAGTYLYSENIQVSGVPVYGQSMTATKLVAKDGGHSAWILSGESPVLSDVAISSLVKPTSRNTSDLATGVEANRASNFLIQRVLVDQTFSAGIIIRGSGGSASSYAKVRDCRVMNTMADGIHITGRSAYVEVSNNTVSNTGDDMVAVVSYLNDGGITHDVNIFDNTLSDQIAGRGISVVGGQNISLENNQITRSSAAGIYLASEASYNTFGVNGVSLTKNVLHDVVTNSATGQGAIQMLGRTLKGSSGLQVQNVTATGNTIDGASGDGIAVGSYTQNVNLVGNQISNVQGSGLFIHANVADIYLGSGENGKTPNLITASGQHGVLVDPTGGSGTLRITGTIFSNLNSRGLGHIDGIYIGRAGSFSNIEITDNQLKQQSGGHLTMFVETLTPVQQFTGNTADIDIRSFLSSQ